MVHSSLQLCSFTYLRHGCDHACDHDHDCGHGPRTVQEHLCGGVDISLSVSLSLSVFSLGTGFLGSGHTESSLSCRHVLLDGVV